MEKKELFQLYEKLYFHELEIKEKLVTRIQINFAIIATELTVISYMLRMLDYAESIKAIILCLLFIVSAIICLGYSIYPLVRAFWGNVFNGIPSPKQTEDYRISIEQHKAQIDSYNQQYPENIQDEINVKEMVMDYLYDKYKDCCTHNTAVNETRSQFIHNSTKWLLISSIPLVIASSIFIILDLDVSSPRKEFPIKDKDVAHAIESLSDNVRDLRASLNLAKESEIMSNQNKPPVPPSPPPVPDTRAILDGTKPPVKADRGTKSE